MVKIEQAEVESAIALAQRPEFIKFMGWLRKSQTDAVKSMTKGDTEFIRARAAGSYMSLDEIIGMVDHAGERVNDIRRRSEIHSPHSM